MKKSEFLSTLRQALSPLPSGERDDIIADYEEHFQIGSADGRREEEIAAALGDPRSLGREYAALSLVKQAEEEPSASGLGRAIIATVGLGLFNLLVVFLPFLFLLLILALILVAGFSLACAGPFLTGYAALNLAGIVKMQLDGPPLAVLFFGIGLTSSGLLLITLDYWLARICYRQAIQYLKWNIAVISGREGL